MKDDIREGIARRLWGFKRSVCNLSNREWAGLPDGAEKRLSRAMAKEIMGYEDSRGVVQIEEKELLKNKISTRRCFTSRGELHAFDTGYFAAQQDNNDSIKRLI